MAKKETGIEVEQYDLDRRIVDDLTMRIVDMFEEDPDITPQHALRACVFALWSALQAIECPGCRKANARMLKKELPNIIKAALKAETIGGSAHVH